MHKHVVVASLPICDLHKYFGAVKPYPEARYDGPTHTGRHGYMCQSCFIDFGIEGSSITTFLVTEKEAAETRGFVG